MGQENSTAKDAKNAKEEAGGKFKRIRKRRGDRPVDFYPSNSIPSPSDLGDLGVLGGSLLKQSVYFSSRNSFCPYSTAAAFSTSTAAILPETSAGISLNTFIASTMHTTVSGPT